MSNKLQRHIMFGTALLGEEDLPSDENLKGGGLIYKKAVHVEDQIARDAQGRRRFHGAFTGGFSAGFFNTVGTKEGWKPATFRSSRTEKQSSANAPKAEDYMDDEDFEEFGIAPKQVEVTKKATLKPNFTVKGEVDDTNNQILSLFQCNNDLTMGLSIFKCLGGREGRGVGPKLLTRKRNVTVHGALTCTDDLSAINDSHKDIAIDKNVETNFQQNAEKVIYSPQKSQSNNDLVEEIVFDAPKSLDSTVDKKVYGCAMPPEFLRAKMKTEEKKYEYLPPDVEPFSLVHKSGFDGSTGLGYTSTGSLDQKEDKSEILAPSTNVKSQGTEGLSSFAEALGSTFRETLAKKRKKGIIGQAFGYGAFDSDEEIEIFDEPILNQSSLTNDKLATSENNPNLLKYDIPLFKDEPAAKKDTNQTNSHRDRGDKKTDRKTYDILTDFSLNFVRSSMPFSSTNPSNNPANTNQNNQLSSISSKQKHNFLLDKFLMRLGLRISLRDISNIWTSKSQPDKATLLSDESNLNKDSTQQPPDHSTAQPYKTHLFLNEKVPTISHIDQKLPSKPLFRPFESDPRKRARWEAFAANFKGLQDSVSRGTCFLSGATTHYKHHRKGHTKKHLLDQMNAKEKESLFNGIYYGGLTEWEVDKERQEFLNLIRITDVSLLKLSDTDDINVKDSKARSEGKSMHNANIASILQKRFVSKGVSLEHQQVNVQELNEQEKKMQHAIEGHNFGPLTTRTNIEWWPHLLICKRFGIRYVGPQAPDDYFEDLDANQTQKASDTKESSQEVAWYNKSRNNLQNLSTEKTEKPPPDTVQHADHYLPLSFGTTKSYSTNEPQISYDDTYDIHNKSLLTDHIKEKEPDNATTPTDNQSSLHVSDDILQAIFDDSMSEEGEMEEENQNEIENKSHKTKMIQGYISDMLKNSQFEIEAETSQKSNESQQYAFKPVFVPKTSVQNRTSENDLKLFKNLNDKYHKTSDPKSDHKSHKDKKRKRHRHHH